MQLALFPPLLSRDDARKAGKKHFFSGLTCGRGHISKRFVSTNQCCECMRIRELKADKKDQYERYGRQAYIDRTLAKPWERSIRNSKYRAKKCGFDFDLTFEWAQERWTGKCELSGIPFETCYTGRQGGSPRSVSIDRMDPAIGYLQSNCWFILFGYNAAKGDGSLENLLSLFGRELQISTKRRAA